MSKYFDDGKKQCVDCCYCYMEPKEARHLCGHPSIGTLELSVNHVRKVTGDCGPEAKLFEPLGEKDHG